MGAAAGSFDDYVVARSAALLRFAYLLARDRGRAEDLVQDALIKAHRRWDSVALAEHPEAYVRQIVVNEFLSWRRRRSNSELSAPVPDTVISDGSDQHAERDLMWRALATLRARPRTVLVLRYYEDLTDPQIAELLGCAVGTVRSTASRALTELRRTMGVVGQPLPTAVEEP